MKNKYIVFFIISITLPIILFSLQPTHAQSNIDKINLQELKFRSIGPNRGGRVTAITGIPSKPFTFFMGSTGGGVWKTNDAGLNWVNISDKYFNVGSIGAIEVALSDPHIIYVGTGSAAPRGNISMGDGLYKSTDGGKTWSHMGLKHTGSISKIFIHPQDPNLVYVAALGNPFGPNPERGLYQSTDGGNTWSHILKIDDHTGAIDLVANPRNPLELYAAFWSVERKPWTLIDGGKTGGIWKTIDGGKSWKQLNSGLPQGLIGKIGLAISPLNPERLWAMVIAAKESESGLYESTNAGQNWSRINRDHKLRQRGWYYSHLSAHPTEPNTLFLSNVGLYKSIDGGKSFNKRIRTPHGDDHGVWINPHHPEIMINCNDGGACVSLNGGQSWSSQNNQPTSEFYRLTIDNQFPYRVYGAQQDNSTISVPSKFESAINPEQHWFAVGGGESGHIAIDPRNPNIIYAGNYIGQITRLDRSKGHARDIVAYPQMHDGQAPRDIKYRFQWNAPIRISPHDPNIVYHCSQYVHRTKDGGQTWETISPDLTTNKDEYHDIPGGPIQHDHTGVELYTTIFSFEESPVEKGHLWAGSDDGLLHFSKDNGKNWKNITPKEMPKEGTINSIDLSKSKPGRAIISVYKYRENDFRPYIFLTENFGKNWTKIVTGIPDNHFVRVAREDSEREGLLFAGTEYGLYYSLNSGKNWSSFQQNLPRTPVTDLQIKDNDLVIATQGRSFWVMDDISPLRKMEEDILEQPFHLYPISSAYRTLFRNQRGPSAPAPAPNGALIYFNLKQVPTEVVQLKIFDDQGNLRRTFSTSPNKKLKEEKLKVKRGLNKFQWDLKYERPVIQPKSFFSLANMGGVNAKIGSHTVELLVGTESQKTTFTLLADPRWTQSAEDLQAQYDLTMKVKELFNTCHQVIGSIRSINDQISFIQKQANLNDIEFPYEKECESLSDACKKLERALIQTKNESGQDPINYPSMLDDQIAYLYSIVNSQNGKPTKGSYDRYKDLKTALDEKNDQFKKIITEKVQPLNQQLKTTDFPILLIRNKSLD